MVFRTVSVITENDQIANSSLKSTGSLKSPSVKPAKPPLPNRPKTNILADVKQQPKKPPPPTKNNSVKKPPLRPPNPNSPDPNAKAESPEKSVVPNKPLNLNSSPRITSKTPERPPKPVSPTSKAKPELPEKSIVLESSPPTTTKTKKANKDFPERPPQPTSPSPKKSCEKPQKPPRANSFKSNKGDIPQRPPNPGSPASQKSKIESTVDTKAMESTSPKAKPQLPPQPQAKPRPIPRPRNDRPVPSPRRKPSNGSFSETSGDPENENTTDKVRKFSENTEPLLHKMELEEQQSVVSEKNKNVIDKEAENMKPVEPPSAHRKVVKQRSRNPSPYENVDVEQQQLPQSPSKRLYVNVSPDNENAVVDGESIYSAPPSSLKNISSPTQAESGDTLEEESIYSAPPSSLKTLDSISHDHHMTEQEDEEIYSSPPSPVKAPLKPTKIQQQPELTEENIYADPSSTLVAKADSHGYRSDPTLTLQSHNRKSISGSFPRPTSFNSNSPVVSYNLLRTGVDPSNTPKDDSNIYSNLDNQEEGNVEEPQEEILYSAPASTPVKASFSSTSSSPFDHKGRSLSELSCGTSIRDDMLSRSSRGSSMMEKRSSVFSEDDTYSVPAPVPGDSSAVVNNGENRYVDMVATTEPAPDSDAKTSKSKSSPYETIFTVAKPTNTGLFACVQPCILNYPNR